jgi:O-Antigen ligase
MAGLTASGLPRRRFEMLARPVGLAALAVGLTACVAYLTLVSLQAACSVAVCCLVIATYAHSRQAGMVSLWVFWLLAPFVRRLFGLEGGYISADPLALAPFVATAGCVALELRAPGSLSRRAAGVMLVAGAGYACGIPAGRGAVSSMLFSLFAYGTAVASFVLGYRETLRSPGRLSLRGALHFAVPLLAAYAVLQYFGPLPKWDRIWLQSVQFVTAYTPDQIHVRAFSTLNSPGTFAAVGALAVLSVIAARRFSLFTAIALLALVAGLALSFVRSAWVCIAIGLLVLAIAARGRGSGRLLVAVGLVVGVGLVLAAANPTLSSIVNRADTLGSTGSDTSAQARLATPQRVVPQAAARPGGFGLGSAGESARLSSSSSSGSAPTLRATDNGYVALIYQLGLVGSLLVLGALIYAMGPLVRGVLARGSNQIAAVRLAMAAFLLAMMFFGDVLYGVTGIVFWYLLGTAMAAEDAGLGPIERRA